MDYLAQFLRMEMIQYLPVDLINIIVSYNKDIIINNYSKDSCIRI